MNMTNMGNTKRTVPYLLIKEWADTEGRVKSVTRESGEFEILGVDEVFTEEYGEGGNPSAADAVFSDVIEKIIRGKEDDSLLTLTAAVFLPLELYGKIPPAPARKDGYRSIDYIPHDIKASKRINRKGRIRFSI